MSSLLSIIMPLTKLIFTLNLIFWLLPPIRQYRNGLFYYFVLLAVTEPIMMILLYNFQVYAMFVYLASSFLLLLTILYYKKRLKVIFILAAFLFTLFFYSNPEDASVGIFFLHCIILYNILDISMKEMFSTQQFNFYYAVLFFYEASIIGKMAGKIIDFSSGIYFYYIITAFDILVAVYFIFYNLKNSLKIKLPGYDLS